MNQMPDIDGTDRALLARLTRIADEIDPVPELAYELGRAAFELRHLDAELAELVEDTATDTESLAGVRGALDVRLLSFEAADLDIDLEVIPRAGSRSLVGQVVGAVTAVRVETAEGIVTAAVDPCGRFQVDHVAAGRMRLHVTTDGGMHVTSWVTV